MTRLAYQRIPALFLFSMLASFTAIDAQRVEPKSPALVVKSSKIESDKAVIAGMVFDPSGAVIPGTTVELRTPKAVVKATVTTMDGTFEFASIAPRTNYDLRFERSGFKVLIISHYHADSGDKLSIRVLLEPIPYDDFHPPPLPDGYPVQAEATTPANTIIPRRTTDLPPKSKYFSKPKSFPRTRRKIN